MKNESSLSTRRSQAVFLVSTLLIALCGIAYELLISSISSYFLGSSIFHFSITIGLFLSFMGVGSFLSKYIRHDALKAFIVIELWLSIVGGFSALLLYSAFTYSLVYYLTALFLTASIGIGIGLEIPLLTRLLKEHDTLENTVAHILSFDYLGSLIASVLFAIVLLPYLGIMRTAYALGMLNLFVAAGTLWTFREHLPSARRLAAGTTLIGVLLVGGFIAAPMTVGWFEHHLYQDPIVYVTQSPYQHIVLTQRKDDTRLFLNGNLQFSSADEYRYHEPLTHVPLGFIHEPKDILILGGGDGLVVRELLKHDTLEHITLVDLDKAMTDLAIEHPLLRRVNEGSLEDSRVEIINQDAYTYLTQTSETFDAIIIDLPDPSDVSLGKLYTREMYTLVSQHLNKNGVAVTQAGSPYFARESFWTIEQTMADVFPFTLPYTSHVPSFGQWGFVAASQHRLDPSNLSIDVETRWLNTSVLPTLFTFDGDISQVPAEVNHLDNQILIQTYSREWNKWFGSM